MQLMYACSVCTSNALNPRLQGLHPTDLAPLQLPCPCTADLKRWVAQSPGEWPDVAFFLNAGDNSACGWACGLRYGCGCTGAGVGWPDVAFFLNAGDNSACGLACACAWRR